MKKLLAVLLCLLACVGIVACNAKDDQTLPAPQGKTFEAVVKEVTDEGFLVMPVEDSEEFDAAMDVGLVVIKRDGMPELKAGDRVRVDYDGSITRSIPGRLGEVYSIHILG